MSGDAAREEARGEKKRLPRVNFRPALYAALFLAFGIFLYLKIRFGSLAVSDFLFIAFFLFFGIPPLVEKRVVPILLLLAIFAGLGALSAHLYTERFLSGISDGYYEVQGVILDITDGVGYSSATLDDVSFDGREYAGKMQVTLDGEGFRRGDIVVFQTSIYHSSLPNGNFYSSYCFENDIRYAAPKVDAKKAGTTSNLLLRLKARLYDTLQGNMDGDAADLSFALLTGDAKGMDGGLKEAVQRGGIAHMFAVSGLHIGILYGALSLVCKRLGKFSVIPSACGALLYSAFCGFTVSSVRAVIMCTALGATRAFGRKTDLLSALSFAAIPVLLFMPAQWLSAGFRLSYGAVLGLALFSGSFSRGMKRIRIPAFLSDYLAASLSVQLFTLPVVLECFGFFPVWGFLLNFFLIPALPFLFLGLLICSVLSLIIPPAAFVFLYVPGCVMSLLPFLFSVISATFVLSGFSLGLGTVVYYTGAVALGGRFRLNIKLRAVAAGVLCTLFVLLVVFENIVVTGCKITVENSDEAGAALVQTRDETVLIVGGGISLSRCDDFLSRRFGGTLDAVIVVGGDEQALINKAAFLDSSAVYACEEISTGLQKTNLVFAESFSVGSLEFRFAGREKLYLLAEGVAVEFDFENSSSLGGDLWVENGSGGLKYFLKNGIIKAI